MDNKPFHANGKNNKRRKGLKNIGFVAILLLIGAIIYAGSNQPVQLKSVPLSEVVKSANAGNYSKITVSGTDLAITEKGKDKPTLSSQKDINDSLVKDNGVDQSKVTVEFKKASEAGSMWANAAISIILPIILFGLLFFFVIRSAQGQGNQAMSFGKSKARLYGNEKDKVVFKDIAGSDEAKTDLAEVVEGGVAASATLRTTRLQRRASLSAA